MKIIKIIIIMMLLFVVSTFAVKPVDPLTFNEGLTLTLDNFDYHTINTDMFLHSHIYDSLTGLQIVNASCNVHIIELKNFSHVYTNDNFTHIKGSYVINKTVFNSLGLYLAEFWCTDKEGLKGTSTEITFEVVAKTKFGNWTCPTDYSFPILYFIICVCIIVAGVYVKLPVISVLGSLMLAMSYFIIGACSPLLLSPLIIIGLLLSFIFASS